MWNLVGVLVCTAGRGNSARFSLGGVAGDLCGWSSDSGGEGRRGRGRLRGSWEGAVVHAGRLSFKFPSEWDEKYRGIGAFSNVSRFREDSLGFERPGARAGTRGIWLLLVTRLHYFWVQGCLAALSWDSTPASEDLL